jgi:hypothetical protein
MGILYSEMAKKGGGLCKVTTGYGHSCTGYVENVILDVMTLSPDEGSE